MKTISSLCLAGVFAMTLFTGAALAQYSSPPAPASPAGCKDGAGRSEGGGKARAESGFGRLLETG